MKRFGATLGTFALAVLFLPASAGCEALLDVGNLTDRAAEAGVGEMTPGTGDDAESGDDAEGADDGPSLDDVQEAGDGGQSGLPPSPPAADGGPTGSEPETDAADAEVIEVSLPSGTPDAAGNDGGTTSPTADTSGKDATVPTGTADSSTGLDSSPAPTDSGLTAPKGCATGVKEMTMPKLGVADDFGTADAICIKYAGNVGGWSASNVEGRTVTVVGAKTQALTTIPEGVEQPAMDVGTDGWIYWNFSAGTLSNSSVKAFVAPR
jgi:hypothetical protein